MPATQGKIRKRTIRLYRHLLAGTIRAGSPAELVARWRSFLATAARGIYVARYRGEVLGLDAADEAAYAALAV